MNLDQIIAQENAVMTATELSFEEKAMARYLETARTYRLTMTINHETGSQTYGIGSVEARTANEAILTHLRTANLALADGSITVGGGELNAGAWTIRAEKI